MPAWVVGAYPAKSARTITHPLSLQTQSLKGYAVKKRKWTVVAKFPNGQPSGVQSGNYFVGKQMLDGCTLYSLFYNETPIKVCGEMSEVEDEIVRYEAK